jgi:hypothetical protein
MDEELDLVLVSVPITTKTRKLKARWTIASELDMFLEHVKKVKIERTEKGFEISDEENIFINKFIVIKEQDKYFFENMSINNETIIEALKRFERKEKLSKLLK